MHLDAYAHMILLALLFGAASALIVIVREAPPGAWKHPAHYAKALFFFVAGTLSLGLAGSCLLVMSLWAWTQF